MEAKEDKFLPENDREVAITISGAAAGAASDHEAEEHQAPSTSYHT